MLIDVAVVKQYCLKIGCNCTGCMFAVKNDCMFNEFPHSADESLLQAAYSKISAASEPAAQSGETPVQQRKGKMSYCAKSMQCRPRRRLLYHKHSRQQLKCAIDLLKKVQSDLIALDFDNGNCADLVFAIDNFVATINQIVEINHTKGS